MTGQPGEQTVEPLWDEMLRMREWLILIAKRPCDFELRDRYRMIEDKCASCIANHALAEAR